MRLSVATTYSIWAVVLTCLTFLLGYSGWLSDSNAKLRIALRERDLAIAALVGAKASSNHETDTVNVSSANAIHQEEASSATKAVLQRLHHITATPTGDIVPSGVADVLCPGQSRPRIAYCVVGAARTFASPQAYMSLKTNVIDAFGGDAHVFLRLKLRDAAPKKQRGYQVPSAHIGNAENLQPAIDMLRPVSVEIIRGESSTNETQNNLPNMQCLNTGFLGEPAHTERLLSQLAAWKHCSLQLQQYETRRGGNFRFDRVILLRPDLAWCGTTHVSTNGWLQQRLSCARYGSVGPHCLYKSDRSYTMRWPMIGPKDPVSKREKLPTLAHIDEHSYCHRSSRPCFPDLAMILTRGHADLVLSALEFYAACRPGMKCCKLITLRYQHQS
eukprot:SAG31_NODE_5_length_43735_cov_42.922266_12_plen_387_part_00